MAEHQQADSMGLRGILEIMKTGFTDQAGTSVVASATMEGHTFIAVVMNGQTLYTKYDDCNTLFEKAFKLYDLEYTTGIE